ncbi:MAG: hypothetical protein PHN46_03465 [Eubacteriales bacterium]|nr:hypothetical protein [Eubacteriales bacterium]
MKRAATLALILLLAIPTALAVGGSFSINSGQSLDSQFVAFRAYLDELPAQDRADWLVELASICQERKEGPENLVWIPESGKKYHSNANCSNMRNPRQIPRQEAAELGFEPCKRCKP